MAINPKKIILLNAAFKIVKIFTTTIVCTFATILTVTAQNLELGNFSKIYADGIYQVQITKADACNVRMEVSPDMEAFAEINVVDNRLNLTCKKGIDTNKGYIKIYIGMPKLEKLDVGGISSVEFSGTPIAKEDDFCLKMKDVAKVKLENISAEKISVDMTGVTELEMKGNCTNLEFKIGGCSKALFDISAKVLQCEATGASKFEGIEAASATIHMHGASKGEIEVKDILLGELDGTSKLTYRTSGTIINTMKTGPASKLQKK